ADVAGGRVRATSARIIVNLHLVPKLRLGMRPPPSFPSSAWERQGAKLRFAAASCRGTGLEAELRDVRSQAELGNELVNGLGIRNCSKGLRWIPDSSSPRRSCSPGRLSYFWPIRPPAGRRTSPPTRATGRCTTTT